MEDRFETVYLVTGPDATLESFELYPDGRTKSDELCRGVLEAGSTFASTLSTSEVGTLANPTSRISEQEFGSGTS